MEWCVASKGGGVALYSRSRGGVVSPPERSGHAANVDERLQRDRAVLRLGEVMDHTQADQTRLYQAGKFLVRNLVAKFGHLLEVH